VRVGSGHHAASPPVDSFRSDAASLNDRFRLGADGRVDASRWRRLPIPDIRLRARRAIAIGRKQPFHDSPKQDSVEKASSWIGVLLSLAAESGDLFNQRYRLV
jgi:hypothetical protein